MNELLLLTGHGPVLLAFMRPEEPNPPTLWCWSLVSHFFPFSLSSFRLYAITSAAMLVIAFRFGTSAAARLRQDHL